MDSIVNEEPYRSFIAMRKSMDTKLGYAGHLGRFKRSGIDPLTATKAEINKYFTDMMASGLSDGSLQNFKSALGKFYRFINKDENSIYYRVDNPMVILDEIELVGTSPNPKALTVEQQKKVFDSLIWEGENATLYERQVSLAVSVAFKTGLRRMEIAKMKWTDLNFETKKFVSIRKRAKHFEGNLPDSLCEELKDYQLFISKIDTQWIFFNRENPSKHLDKVTIWHFFKVIGKRVGFDVAKIPFHTHVGRHGFCTSLFRAGVKDQVAIKATGHDKVDVYQRYCRIDEDEIRGEVNRAIK